MQLKGCGVLVVVVALDMMSFCIVLVFQHGPTQAPARLPILPPDQPRPAVLPMKSVVNRDEPPKWVPPCLVKFRTSGILEAPDKNTTEGVRQCKYIADEWSRKRNIDRDIVGAWRSRDVTRDKSNPDELTLFQYETSIRSAVYQVK